MLQATGVLGQAPEPAIAVTEEHADALREWEQGGPRTLHKQTHCEGKLQQQTLREQERARGLKRKRDQELKDKRELPAIDPKFNESCVKLSKGHLEGDYVVAGACFFRRRVQRIITDIVLDMSKVFNKHNITHFLDSGTLLGQFQNQAMIPFDQDADMGIDEVGFKIIQSTPIQFPDKYASHVFDSRHHPRGSRYIELPARVIHRESALYMDIFMYKDSFNATAGGKVTGPISSGCFKNCRQCPEVTTKKWQFQVPYDWIYPLQDCQFAGHTLKCLAKRVKCLEYRFGEDYMTPREFHY